MAFQGCGFSGPLEVASLVGPDHRFNDLKIITTIYCNHTLGMTGRLNCNYHVDVPVYVVSNIDELRDENVQVFSGVFTI